MKHVLLEAICLSVGYNKRKVLEKVNFTVHSGQFVALLGPNGAGKTTLLKTLAKLINPLKGSVLIDGSDIRLYKSRKLAQKLSVVLTGHVARNLFSVEEFVALGRYPYTNFMGTLSDIDKKEVRRALKLVRAEHLAQRTVGTLSDGERQKVVLARAIAQKPSLLLLDEPTIHLDLKHRIEILSILRELCRSEGISVIASLHDVDIAFKIADIVGLVKDGAIEAWGPPEHILKENVAASLYGFDSARFDPRLGSIEWKASNGGKSLFIVAGIGSGAVLYRILNRHGYSISTGIIHKNDIDYYVASAMEIDSVACDPMDDISIEQFHKAIRIASSACYVIDAGFVVKRMNQMNVRLVTALLNEGKTVFSLRRPEDAYRLFGSRGRLVCCPSVDYLLRYLNNDGKGVVFTGIATAK